MKRSIFKLTIVVFFIGALFANFNVDNKISTLIQAEAGDCDTYCPNGGLGCLLIYSNGAMVTCLSGTPEEL